MRSGSVTTPRLRDELGELLGDVGEGVALGSVKGWPSSGVEQLDGAEEAPGSMTGATMRLLAPPRA